MTEAHHRQHFVPTSTSPMEPWQSQALHSAMKTLCGVAPSSMTPSASVSPSVSAHLSSAVPLSVLSILYALSPRASRSALLELEEAARQFPRADLVSAAGEPLPRPHVLRGLAHVLVERRSGRVLVRVGCRGDGGGREYTVVLRDLRCGEIDGMKVVAGHDQALMDVNCDCKAFAFRAVGETVCKHVVVAVVAAAAHLAPRCFVGEDEFVGMLKLDP